MDLNEYIRQSYKRPNRKVLEGLGAMEEQIGYIMETPSNFNWSVWSGLGSGSSEVKYVIKLAQYGQGPEIYAEDSPWKPSNQDINEIFNSILGPKALLEAQKRGYNSADEWRSNEEKNYYVFIASLINQYILVYNQNNKQMYSAVTDWIDSSEPVDVAAIFDGGSMPEFTEAYTMGGGDYPIYQTQES